MVDGGEPSAFKQFFSSWKEAEVGEGGDERPYVGIGGRAYTREQVEAFDVGHLHAENRRRLARWGEEKQVD